MLMTEENTLEYGVAQRHGANVRPRSDRPLMVASRLRSDVVDVDRPIERARLRDQE
jgi:hypothetical protein